MAFEINLRRLCVLHFIDIGSNLTMNDTFRFAQKIQYNLIPKFLYMTRHKRVD
jgi:hypothetical protein